MQFSEFLALPPQDVRDFVMLRNRRHVGVAIPFNGTRRWYLSTFNKPLQALYEDDYSIQARRRTFEIIAMMFADGVTTVYSPMVGRALIERGPEYMAYAARALLWLADDDAQTWYRQNGVGAACYGDLDLLPPEVAPHLADLGRKTGHAAAERSVRWGVFADQPVQQFIRRTVHLAAGGSALPDEKQLLEDYYGGPVDPVDIWIGTEQPTVFDVPFLIHGHAALYFLQFPTPYLDVTLWRRVLYDYLFIRGDEESLNPGHVSPERQIIGLGERKNGNWIWTVS